MKAAAPWVRTRLRTAPGPAVALLLLVLVTSFLAAAFPRAVDTYEGQGLRHEMSSASPERSAIQLTDEPMRYEDSGPGDWADSLQSRRLAGHHREILAALPKPLRADTGQSAYGARILEPVAATDEWLPQLDGGGTVFTLVAQAGMAEHSTLASGRLPGATADSATPAADAVEAAVTSATAASLHIKAGSTIHVPRPGGAPLAVHVTGIVEPLRPDLSYWSVEPVLRTPTRLYTAQTIPQPYWHGALLLAPEAAPVLLSVTPETEAYWRIAPDPAGVGIADVPRITRAIASLEHGPLQSALRTTVSPQLQTESGLDGVLIDFDVIGSAIGPVVAVAAFGVGSIAGVVLLMAGGLAAARRHAELSLLRSRGASVRGIAGRLLAEAAVPVLPAAAVGCALALVIVPEGRMLPPLLASAAVALVACAALPLRAAFLHRRPRLHGERDDVVRARPSRRRTVAELTLLVLTVAAVAALRRRGTSDGDVDELVSAAPVLVSVIAALVLVRLYPLPLRLAALPIVRRRGAIGFLSLARAGRAPSATALPLLALLVALTTAAFGGSVLAGVADARDRASLVAVGADARIDSAEALPDALAGKIRKVAGVRDVVPVRSEYDLDLRDARTESVTLLAVDPDSYARLAHRTGLGAFRADELRKSSGVLPALASPAVAERLRGRTTAIGPAGGLFTVRVDVVRSATPAVAEGDFLVVDAGGLPGSRPATTLLISGPSADGAGLEAAARTAGSAAAVTTRSAVRDGFTESPVQSGAERIYLVAAVAGAGYAVLALVLSLLQTAPERSALLGRLRTMGLTRRQGRRLLILENLPQALLAAVGGALVGWAAIRLLAPGIDLGRLALATQGGFTSLGPVQLRADPVSLLLPALAVVVIASAVAAAQARVATRRTTTTELRAGDTR
ncbi:ABC transporter permease [Streptomyces sp. NRRL S-4]|uniref:ABC transporter permease n=1 Tax=Streptomyces sp. NRRL S-4 TaxID=1519471 RepID=UPI0006B509B6|nr:FtsX-like permease family protein [Streptomyces sp. NRRL S-4]KPC78885.1 membrane protein [Streptomyces sp. NRRL S-4]